MARIRKYVPVYTGHWKPIFSFFLAFLKGEIACGAYIWMVIGSISHKFFTNFMHELSKKIVIAFTKHDFPSVLGMTPRVPILVPLNDGLMMLHIVSYLTLSPPQPCGGLHIVYQDYPLVRIIAMSSTYTIFGRQLWMDLRNESTVHIS